MAARAVSSAPPIRRLGPLLAGFAVVEPTAEREIRGLALDSRRVGPGDLFLACPGTRCSGLAFVDEAIAAGAAAIVYDGADPAAAALDRSRQAGQTPMIAVAGLVARVGEIAARFHDEPARDMTVIGITGTNGKTSCAHYLAQALAADGAGCGVIGTVGYGLLGALRPATLTTPDAVTLQDELARIRDVGVDRVVMEVSSHALEQCRTAGIDFSGALFTNLSHEHLDYHADLESYGLAKKKLFMMPGLRFAAINRDDPFGRALIAGLPAAVRCVGYGLGVAQEQHAASLYVEASEPELSIDGMRLDIRSSWGEGRLRTPLIGRFNAHNLLAVLSALLLMNMPLPTALQRLSAVRAVPGRMERFGGREGRPLVVVDYAHTPDALAQALEALRPHCTGRLWCVFGCGGDRDPSKRPLMGAVAARLADRVVLTSDNPRLEDPQRIIADILAGIGAEGPVEQIPDRAAAIGHAIAAAGVDDVVLVAGKGHEEYQVVGTERRDFSDRRQVSAALDASPEKGS